MTDEIAKIKGKSIVTFMRNYAKRTTVAASLIPYQTGMTFGVSRDSDSTSTKDSSVTTQGALETDFSVDFLNNSSVVADEALQAAIDGSRIEAWRVNRDRRNSEGKCEAWYVQGTISEDSSDNDADDNSTRSLTIAVDGEPKHGWVKLTDEQEELIDYVFHGLGAVGATGETGADIGEGTTWDNTKDNGVNATQTASDSGAGAGTDTGTP